MAKKGRPNRCYHRVYYDILKELERTHNLTQLRSNLISKGQSIEPTPLRGYTTDLIAMGLVEIHHIKPRTTKHKLRLRGSRTLRDLGSPYYSTTAEGRKYLSEYDDLEGLLYIPEEDSYVASVPAELGGDEGEFPLTPGNLAVLEAKLGKDRSKWVGHRFDAHVIPFRDKKNNVEYLGWSIIEDSIR